METDSCTRFPSTPVAWAGGRPRIGLGATNQPHEIRDRRSGHGLLRRGGFRCHNHRPDNPAGRGGETDVLPLLSDQRAVLFSDFTTRQDHILELIGARPIGESPLESVISALREMSITPPDARRVRRIQRIVRASPSLLERERTLVQYGFADR